jgi:hypothetical protein
LVNLFTQGGKAVGEEEVENRIGLIVMYTRGVFEEKRADVGVRMG